MSSKLYVVGIGPGKYEMMTAQAVKTLNQSEYIVGYERYIQYIQPYFDKKYVSSGMTEETLRVEQAIELVKNGFNVSIVSSGDPGVYAMACLAIEKADNAGIEVIVIPGITAANSAAAILGSPLTLDYCVISLSDLLVPWPQIKNRLECFAKSQAAMVIYNPRSTKRLWQLKEALEIFRVHRKKFIVAVVKNAYLEDQEVIISDSSREDWIEDVDMMSTVFFCSEDTVILNGMVVLPRGYFR